MTMFSVKVTTQHEGCKRVCKLDVIAKDWLAAGQKALDVVQPVGSHRLSVMPHKQQGSVSMPMNWTLAAVTVLAFFGLQALVQYQEQAIAEHALSANISGAVLQCLPEQVDEVCMIKLVKHGGQNKLVTERHTTTHYGQGIKKPSVHFVVALGE